MSDVYSNELEVDVSTSTSVVAELTHTQSPILEIVVEPSATTSITQSPDTTFSTQSSIVEIVTDVTMPVVDLVVTEQPIIDIIGEGMPGPKGPEGPPGPQGPSGPPGSGAIEIEKVFAAAEKDWVWDHNLNTYFIEVNVFDHLDRETLAEVEYTSPNQIIVRWYYPESGRVRIIG